MMSIASTRKVQTKGRISVRYSKRATTAKTKRAVDRKNSNQYSILELRDLVVIYKKILGKNSREFLDKQLGIMVKGK